MRSKLISTSSATCFVINLDRSKDRLEDIRSQFATQSLPFERIDAVNGAAMGEQELAEWYSPNHTMHYYKRLNPAEIACYLSHRKAWQHIVDRALPFAIILEDDISISGDLAEVANQIAQWPGDWDYIKLAEHSRRRRIVLEEQMGEVSRVTYHKVPARTCAQVVSFEGAKKLLDHSQNIARPIDIDLQYWWEKNLRIFGYQPYPVEPNMHWESEIDKLAKRSHTERHGWLKVRQQIAFVLNNNKNIKKRLATLNAMRGRFQR